MRSLLLASAAVLGLAASAQAAQITIGNSTSGQDTFTGLGNGNLTINQSAITGTASDSLGGTGTYTISAFGPVTATQVGTTGVFDFNTTATFTYTSGGNSLTETFGYNSVNDGSVNPHFAGTDDVTAITGSAAFVAAFGPVGNGSTFDYATLAVGTVLDTLAKGTASESVGISSGEVVPNSKVPEPSTLLILGSGLLGLAALRFSRRS